MSKKQLERIRSRLEDLCKEESDSMPIYQCISYLNDSLIDDLDEIDIDSEHNNTVNEEKQNDDDADDGDHHSVYSFVGDKNKNKNTKNKEKESENEQEALPTITIYSWGNKCRKKAPIASQHNTNVCGVTGYKPRGLNLKQLNGKDERIQKHVEGGRNYHQYLENLKNKIIKEVEKSKKEDTLVFNIRFFLVYILFFFVFIFPFIYLFILEHVAVRVTRYCYENMIYALK